MTLNLAAFLALDWSRPVLFVLPPIGLISGIGTGVAGLGGAIISTALWQLAWIVFHVPETDSLELLVLLITLAQCNVVAYFACNFWATWWRLFAIGAPYAIVVMVFSPLGAFCRDRIAPQITRSLLAWVFVVFVSVKLKLPQCLRDNTETMQTADPELQARAQIYGIARKVSPHLDPNLCMQETSHMNSEVEGDAPEQGPLADSSVGLAVSQAKVHAGETLQLVENSESQDIKSNAVSQQDPEILEFDLQKLAWSLPCSGIFTGILGGIAGLTGPPFILLVTLYAVPKDIARPLFPFGMALELPIRLGVFLVSRDIALVVQNVHIILFYLVANQLGLRIGNCMSSHVSQAFFEATLLVLLLISSLVILGITGASLQSLLALVLTIVTLSARAVAHRRGCN